jgi:hypothetical protein
MTGRSIVDIPSFGRAARIAVAGAVGLVGLAGGSGLAGLVGLVGWIGLAGCGPRAGSDPPRPIDGPRVARSRAAFVAASEVFLHPRCANCHPDDGAPRRGDASLAHDPPVVGGPAGAGVPGMECRSCHQDRGVDGIRVPGAPGWRLAPPVMAWHGRSAAAICAQLKDPARNGGRTLAQIVEHVTQDPLVGWGWAPGTVRTPVPVSQGEFARLLAEWIETGAACPRPDRSDEREEARR